MRRILLSLAFLSIIINAKAQDATPLSLQQCVDYALKHNYTVKNADLDFLIQKAQYNQTSSAVYPHLNGKVDYTQTIDPQYQYVPASAFSGFFSGGSGSPAPSGVIPFALSIPYMTNVSVTATQTIFDGSLLVALKAKNTVFDLARLSGDVTKETVRYNVTKAYNSLVIAHRQLDIVKNSLSFARQIEHDINVTREQGFAEKIEVERTSVQVNNLATDSIKISNLLVVSEQLLKYQMGMNLNTPIVLIDTNIEDRKADVLELLDKEEDYKRLPEYGLVLTQLKANELNVQRYKLAALPTLSAFLNGGTNYGHYDLPEIFKPTNYTYGYLIFGLELNVPIFNGLMRANQLKEAKINVEKSQNTIEYTKQSIDFQVEQARVTLRNAVLQVQTQHRNTDLANDVLDLAQKKYKAGVGSNQEVTQAQTDQLQAQNNYFSALLDLVNAETDLRKALGLLK